MGRQPLTWLLGQEGASEAAVQSHIPPTVSIPFIAFLREVGWDLKATHFPISL